MVLNDINDWNGSKFGTKNISIQINDNNFNNDNYPSDSIYSFYNILKNLSYDIYQYK